jgi:hypothetical protein
LPDPYVRPGWALPRALKCSYAQPKPMLAVSIAKDLADDADAARAFL